MWLCKLHNFGGKKSVMCSLEGYIYIRGIACYSTASMAICVLRRAQETPKSQKGGMKMKLNYNVTGSERKSLVGAISTELNAPTK